MSYSRMSYSKMSYGRQAYAPLVSLSTLSAFTLGSQCKRVLHSTAQALYSDIYQRLHWSLSVNVHRLSGRHCIMLRSGICRRLHWALSVKGRPCERSDAWVMGVEGLARECLKISVNCQMS